MLLIGTCVKLRCSSYSRDKYRMGCHPAHLINPFGSISRFGEIYDHIVEFSIKRLDDLHFVNTLLNFN